MALDIVNAAAELNQTFLGQLRQAWRRRIRRCQEGAQRPHRQAAGAHRPLPRRGRRRGRPEAIAARASSSRSRSAAAATNVAGRATTEGGLDGRPVADEGHPRRPAGAAPPARQGGATWNGFNRETQLHGLATTGGVVSSTGIAGLTLGGGLGWLMGKHGLALDNLLSAEVVLADGGSSRRAPRSIPTCSGRCAAAAATSAWWPPSSTACTRSGRMVTGGLIAYPFSGLGRAPALPRRHGVASRRVHLFRRAGRTRRTARARSWRRWCCATAARSPRARPRSRRSRRSARRRSMRSGRCRTRR